MTGDASSLPPENGPHENGPMAAYLARVDAGELALDDTQHLALQVLDQLHGELQGAKGPSLLTRLMGGKSTAPAGLYLHGPVGRGKSMLMDFFTQTSPIPARRVHFHAFMQEVHATLHDWRQMDAPARKAVGFKGDDPVLPLAKKLARDVRLLCLDELEINDIADAMIVGRLFAGLLQEGVVVVITSNRHPRDLYHNGLNRQLFEPFIDLMIERFQLVRLDADRDYRLSDDDKPYYLTPLHKKAKAAMTAIFKERAGGKGKPDVVTVHGRKVPVPSAAGGVARFSFDDLCAQPLGAADYLALAKRFDVILMDDIPLLGRENRNEARRFVTFIDIIYDQGVAFICSAAALPDRLYPEGDGQFEFQRTASRLEEMARGKSGLFDPEKGDEGSDVH